ncbi:PEP-CTERM sorting domain-containing protein [Thiohalocapsa sp. ML1]|uniref:PEP-CTERM sorting domain-containing protein n=1 Tax=Thiohalocapsa sp. ML1 TaxID=1431688 RepID=UPI0012E3E1AA|nr:PEP-CTERM sorting domain-containing protein [Thiohalocapsa sp. ML1]
MKQNRIRNRLMGMPLLFAYNFRAISPRCSVWPANAEHELYVYTQDDSGANGRRMALTPAGGSTVITDPADANANTFILGQNYLRLDVMSDASGVLSFDYVRHTSEANLNGLQLVVAEAQAPAPASLGLLAAGGLVLAAVRRRRPRSAA